MSVTTPPARSKVVLQQSASEPVLGVAVRLLGILGHEVATAGTTEAVIAESAARPAALLVLTVSDPDEQGQCLDRLALLPADRRPKQVAILSDQETETSSLLHRRLPGVKVRVFGQAVHALGLLDVIKRLDSVHSRP